MKKKTTLRKIINNLDEQIERLEKEKENIKRIWEKNEKRNNNKKDK